MGHLFLALLSGVHETKCHLSPGVKRKKVGNHLSISGKSSNFAAAIPLSAFCPEPTRRVQGGGGCLNRRRHPLSETMINDNEV